MTSIRLTEQKISLFHYPIFIATNVLRSKNFYVIADCLVFDSWWWNAYAMRSQRMRHLIFTYWFHFHHESIHFLLNFARIEHPNDISFAWNTRFPVVHCSGRDSHCVGCRKQQKSWIETKEKIAMCVTCYVYWMWSVMPKSFLKQWCMPACTRFVYVNWFDYR